MNDVSSQRQETPPESWQCLEVRDHPASWLCRPRGFPKMRHTHIITSAAQFTKRIKLFQTLYRWYISIFLYKLPWGRSVSWWSSFCISPGSPGLSLTPLCTSLYLGALSCTSALQSLSFSHVWAVSSLHTNTHTHTKYISDKVSRSSKQSIN